MTVRPGPSGPPFRRRRPLPGWPLLGALFLLALGLRLYGMDWDGGALFHPDERAILMRAVQVHWPPLSRLGLLLDPEESPWNPRWFPYGTLPLYLLKGAEALLSPFVSLDVFTLRFPGRALTALADSLTVLVVALLGARLYGRAVGLLAGALTALAVLHLQLAHFFTVDPFLTLFVVLTLLFLVRWAEGGGPGNALAAGAFLGLAVASKVSALPLFLPLGVAGVLVLAKGGGPVGPRFRRAGLGVGGALGVGVLAFFLAEPYAFLDWRRFLEDTLEQARMVRRALDLPYTRQYIGTPPYLYYIKHLTLFGLGPPLGVVAWTGLLGAVALALARREWGTLLLLSWVLPYGAITGAFPVKFLRYVLPLVPLLLLFGVRVLVEGWRWARQRRPHLAPWVMGAGAFIFAFALFYALAYLSLYSRPHPAWRASRWLQENAPPGAVVLKEHWEEGLPDLGRYRVVELPLYDPDTPEKMALLAERLSEADYLVLYSQRLYATIPRLPERYPWSARYYRLLFEGGLGYRLARYEASHPVLLGIGLMDEPWKRTGLPPPGDLALYRPAFLTFRLGPADESFTVYDHPLVLVFRNEERLPRERLLSLLAGGEPRARGDDPFRLPWGEWAPRRAGGGRWQGFPTPGDFADRFPLLVWLVAVYAFSLAVFPLGAVLFRPLGDRGYLLARPLGLLLWAYTPWLLASLGWAPFSRASVFLGLGLLTTGGLAVAVRRWGEIREFLRRRWPVLLAEEGVFLIAFLAFVALRMANPDLWHPVRGGEKPMDLAYLNAVVRSPFLPPLDPWYAGGAMNYYYFGQFLVAVLVKATGLATTVAYNLAVPLFFALTVGSAFSIGFSLGAPSQKNPCGGFVRGALGAGLVGALLVGVVGNLDGAVQVGERMWRALRGLPVPPFDYWRPSRMMPPDPPGFEITEFPFFTFLFADLHAHLLALPLVLLSLGSLLAHLRAPSRPRLVLLSLAVGSLALTNLWDFPIYLALGAVGLVGAEYLQAGRFDGRALGRAVAGVAAFLALALLLFLPYHLRLLRPDGGLVPSPARTPLHQYLAIHGLFLLPLLTLLLQGVVPAVGKAVRRSPLVGAGGLVAVGSLLLALVLAGYSTVAFLLLLLMGTGVWGWRGRAHPEAPTRFFLVLLMGTAFLIGIGADLAAVEGDIDRMNTVFKTYLQGWVLLALACAGALARLRWGGVLPGLWRPLWRGAFALLFLSALVYPVLGTRARLADRFLPLPPTLDGSAYMDRAVYADERGAIDLRWDKEAFRWVQEEVRGSPVIVEGRTPLYRWGGRFSIYTGLPSVLGWDWHQIQQRCGLPPCPAVEGRAEEVDRFYTTPDPEEARRFLQRYGVEYVIVGQVERLYYPPAGLAKFEAMERRGYLRPVYENPGVRIYQVVQE